MPILKEIKNISDLEVGSVYATFWVAHELDSRKERISYIRVIGVGKKRIADCGYVRSDAGNRTFSKLRWFGPLPGSRADLLGDYYEANND